MNWIYWVLGVLWVLDGFFCFVYPRLAKYLLLRSVREKRALVVSAGPLVVCAGLFIIAPTSSFPKILYGLAVFSLLQTIIMFFSAYYPSKARQFFLLLAPWHFRSWGIVFTLLGPILICSRP